MKSSLFIVFCLIFCASVSFAQTKSITNESLKKIREARLKADAEYREERRRKGLPPLEEVEKEREKAALERRELAAKLERERNLVENAYLNQALALRAEIVSIDAQIEYVRARLRQIPRPQIYYAVNYLPFFSYFPGNFPSPFYYGSKKQVTINQGRIADAPQTRTAITGQTANSGFNIIFTNEPNTRPNLATGTLVVPFTFPTYDDLTREELNATLRALQQTRAGLLARYRLLEEEARKNGVRID